jgi:arylsulfatase A-like enzyme
MERRDFLKAVSLGAAGAMVSPIDKAEGTTIEPKESKPNIVVIISDQHRAGLTKRSGYPLDTSPTLDRLAEGGVCFDRAYATAPLCVPSRISFLTGRWPEAHRVRMNLDANDAYFDKDLYQVARETGYRTGLAGKNHTYLKPKDLDFWRAYGHTEGWEGQSPSRDIVGFDHWIRNMGGKLCLEPTPFPLETQFAYRIVTDAIEFLDQNGSQPFILQVGFPEPHPPEQVPEPYWNMYPPDEVPPRIAGPEALQNLGYRAQWLYGLEQTENPPGEPNWRRYVSNYLGMLRLLDDQLARLISHMRQKDLLRNSIIVYLADHGDYVMEYGLGRKGVGLFECLTRIPMVWYGHGIRPSQTLSSAFVSMADVMPTLCAAMGAEIPHGVQGRSLWPLLQAKDYPREEFRSIYAGVGVGGLYYDSSDGITFSPELRGDTLDRVTQAGNQKMVRMGDWKLVYDMMGYGQLYHLPSDPCELNNLFGQPPVQKEQSQLMAELLMWTIRCQDSLPTGPQNLKYQTKWSKENNWYAPYRHGEAPEPFIP